MTCFRRMHTLQKFSAVHASFHNHFASERHGIDRNQFKANRSAALAEWRTSPPSLRWGCGSRASKETSRLRTYSPLGGACWRPLRCFPPPAARHSSESLGGGWRVEAVPPGERIRPTFHPSAAERPS